MLQAQLHDSFRNVARNLDGIAIPNESDLWTITFPQDKIGVSIEIVQSPSGVLYFSCDSPIGYIRGQTDFRLLLVCNSGECGRIELVGCYYSINQDNDGDLLELTYTFLASPNDIPMIEMMLQGVVSNMRKFNLLSRSLPGIVPLIR